VKHAAGFTLLEVIIALAILSIAVVASIQGFAQGLRLLKLAGDHQRATLLADQKLREVVTPQEGREDEEDRESGFAWERVTTAVETPDLTGDGTRTPTWRVWQITVRVRWGERRQVELATLRTVPVSPESESGTGASDPRSTTTPARSSGPAPRAAPPRVR
jgi:general secretion pathway protein I